ncbi:MAG: methyltransferase domain-containing protein [Pseudomonadota bacterium]
MALDPKNVGDGIIVEQGKWTFAGNVCDKFDSHVKRSIPLYAETHELIADIASGFVDDHSIVYDFGCSTGSLCRLLAQRFSQKQLNIIGIDLEQTMCDTAAKRLPAFASIQYLQGNLLDSELQASDFIACCYVIQFLARADRPRVVKRAFNTLKPGGGFVLVEKVRTTDSALDALYKKLYYDFKRRCGYSDSEILAKEKSLQGILDPMTDDENHQMLKSAGFGKVHSLFQHLCFKAWLAVK